MFVPSPSLPYLLFPQHFTMPFDIAQVWTYPADTLFVLLTNMHLALQVLAFKHIFAVSGFPSSQSALEVHCGEQSVFEQVARQVFGLLQISIVSAPEAGAPGVFESSHSRSVVHSGMQF